MDSFGMEQHGHMATTKYLREAYRISPWWAQVLVVKYEYKKGLRK